MALAGFLGRSWWVLDLVASLRWQLVLAACVVTALATVTVRWRAGDLRAALDGLQQLVVLPFRFQDSQHRDVCPVGGNG
jgi:hypothetical protein